MIFCEPILEHLRDIGNAVLAVPVKGFAVENLLRVSLDFLLRFED